MPSRNYPGLSSLRNGFPRIGVANPFADLAGDSDKMQQGRVAVVPHTRGAVTVPGCRPGKWYETDAGRNEPAELRR